MHRINRVEVEGLFGYVNHAINIRTTQPTMITAPNGAGKTHILTLIGSALELDLRTLAETMFAQLTIQFADARELIVRRALDDNAGVKLSFEARHEGKRLGKVGRINSADIERLDPNLPPHLRQISNRQYLDMRTDRVLSRLTVERMYGHSAGSTPADLLKDSPELLELVQQTDVVLIDTKRLDALASEGGTRIDHQHRSEGTVGASRIHEYTGRLRAQVTEARRGSIQATQSADLSFAARALAAADLTVKESELHKRYDRIVELYERLARNSLAIGEAPMDFPPKTTPTVRRILSVFLDDWEGRLQPLLPLNDKIQTLREVLDSKLASSGKRTAMSARGDLEFRSHGDRRIRVARLSSGEQHLVALFTMLLFSANKDSLVLIDEPEISLHAAWKHAFLEDISRVADLANLQVILATHSSAIINGNWDLVEELDLSQSAQAASHDADELLEDDETDEIIA